MYEQNELTKKLIAEGYDEQNHPSYVKVAGSSLRNIYGGFEYQIAYIEDQTFETPCGLLCKGKTAMSGMSFHGTDWSFENDCPTIICPMYRIGCEKNHEFLRDQKELNVRCAVHRSNREYRSEGSVEHLAKKHEEEKQLLKEKFIEDHGGRVCDQHMRYDPLKRQWSFCYDAMVCAGGNCRVQNTSFTDGSFCPVLGKPITRETGNVFYDIRYSGLDYSKDGTIFEGERFEAVIKDIPLFQKPIRYAIAEIIAKTQRDHILFKARYNSRWTDSMTLYRAEIGEIDFKWEVENIRAEKKLVRNLEDDLKDIENGVVIRHEFDEQRKAKEAKREKKQKRNDALIGSLEKKILKDGFGNLDPLVRKRIAKYISKERIRELDRQREKRLEEEKEKPQQISIFDFIEA